MADEQMALLDTCGDRRGSLKAQLGFSGAVRTFFTREGDANASTLVGGLKREKDVFARSASGDAECDISGLGKCFDLTGEDGLETEIVAMRGEDRSVGGQSETGERRAIDAVTNDEFSGEMLRVGGAATVAEEDDFFAASQRGEPSFGQWGGLITHRTEFGDGVLMLAEMRFEKGWKIGAHVMRKLQEARRALVWRCRACRRRCRWRDWKFRQHLEA